MFVLPGSADAMAKAAAADLLAFSLITLAILPPEGCDTLLALARQVRGRGGMVAFDGNYRARLWGCAEEARGARDAAIACATIGLPTLEDEQMLGAAGDAAAVAAHWSALGCCEVVVKLGPRGCFLTGGAEVAPRARLQPVDTSGAGDAFNAGYLGARLTGGDCRQAAMAGHDLAAWTIMRPGAIPAI